MIGQNAPTDSVNEYAQRIAITEARLAELERQLSRSPTGGLSAATSVSVSLASASYGTGGALLTGSIALTAVPFARAVLVSTVVLLNPGAASWVDVSIEHAGTILATMRQDGLGSAQESATLTVVDSLAANTARTYEIRAAPDVTATLATSGGTAYRRLSAVWWRT